MRVGARILVKRVTMLRSVSVTFVGVVKVPDLAAVVVFEQVDDCSRVQRSHVDVVAEQFAVLVLVNVVVVVRQQDVLSRRPSAAAVAV